MLARSTVKPANTVIKIIVDGIPIISEETAASPKVGEAKAAPAPAVIFRNSRRFTSNFDMDYSYFLW